MDTKKSSWTTWKHRLTRYARFDASSRVVNAIGVTVILISILMFENPNRYDLEDYIYDPDRIDASIRSSAERIGETDAIAAILVLAINPEQFDNEILIRRDNYLIFSTYRVNMNMPDNIGIVLAEKQYVGFLGNFFPVRFLEDSGNIVIATSPPL